jgi:putative acetyltransferase
VSEVRIALEPAEGPEIEALVAALDAYLRGLYPPESNHGLDMAALQRPAVRFAVARRAGQALGCGALVLRDDGTAELKRMYVRPDARGLGLGRRLLDALEEVARQSGCAAVQLETGIRQPEALGLYRTRGYTEVPPFPPYRADPNSLFMERRL